MSLTSTPSLGSLAANHLRRYQGHRRPGRSGALHRTGAPVRRGSLEAGTFEDGVFTGRYPPGEPDRLYGIARHLREQGRSLMRKMRAGNTLSAIERDIAALTDSAVHLYDKLCELARLGDGTLEPSYAWMEKKSGLSHGTIAANLTLLEELGFLMRQRRFKRVEDELGEKRYKQTSNVYRLLMPKKLLRFVPRRYQPAPIPPDEEQRQQDRREEQQHMLAGLSCRDLARVTVGGALGRMLERLGDSIDRRSGCESSG